MAGEIRVSLEPLVALSNHLTSTFVAREREVVAVLAGLASGEPVFLCGPPGTAKTALVEEVARCLNAKYFYYLLTRFTEPDELLGPLNVVALREGRWERVSENRLPTADLVFLDEVFKAGSAILNTLLDIILNRRILNGTTYVQLPLLALYTASNEVTSDADLVAFYDRLLIRVFVNHVPDHMLEDLLVRGVALDTRAPRRRPQVSVEYVKRLQAFTKARARLVAGDSALRSKVADALLALKEKGLQLSDRRKVKLLKVFAAVSTVLGEESPSVDSLAEALRLVAPHDEDELRKVEEVIVEKNLSSVNLTALHVVMEEAEKKVESALKALKSEALTVKELNDLEAIYARLSSVYRQIPNNLATYSLRVKVYGVLEGLKKVLSAAGIRVGGQ